MIESGTYKLEFEIPYLNEIIERELVIVNNVNESDEWFSDQFKSIDSEINNASKHLEGEGKQKLERIKFTIGRTKNEFENDKKDEGIRLQVKDELKRQFTALDLLEIEIELKKLEEVFNTIKKEINETENQLHKNDFRSIEERIETVKTSEDFIQIFDLREECDLLLQKIIADKLGDKRFRASIIWYHQNFDSLEWKEDRKNEAKNALDAALADFANLTEEKAIKIHKEILWPSQLEPGPGPDGPVIVKK